VKTFLIRVAVLSIAAAIIQPAFAQSSGADVYKAKCVMCHGADGSGATPAGKALKAASFKDPSIVNTSDSVLNAVVTKGKGKMPANQGKLTDTQIKAAIAYVRTLQK
jgi:mono/diheme cytochrome c family protein